jgi:hypothetical protein
MSLPSFTGLSPAATRGYILHISDATLPTAHVYTGAGVQTPLSFTVTGISVNGEVEADTLSLSAGATIAGTLVLGGVTVRPALWKVASATVTATTTTQVAIADFAFTPALGATYELEMLLIATSPSSATGVRIVNTGGTGTLALLDNASAFGITATGGAYAQINAAQAGTFGILLKGVFVATSTADLTWSIVSEVAASAVSIAAGSYLRLTRIA